MKTKKNLKIIEIPTLVQNSNMEKNYIVHKSTLFCQFTHNLFALKMFDLIFLFIVIFLFLSKILKGISFFLGFAYYFTLHTSLLYVFIIKLYQV
jgi:hypothetical protein